MLSYVIYFSNVVFYAQKVLALFYIPHKNYIEIFLDATP